MNQLILKYKIYIILFISALVVGLFWNQRMFNAPIESDEIIYKTIAQSLYDGNGFSNTGEAGTIEPGYPLFLAGIFQVFGMNDFNAVRAMQIVFFACSILLLFRIVCLVSSRRVAVVSSILLILFGGLATEAGKLHKETLFTFLLLVGIYFLIEFERNLKFRYIFFAGIFFGIAIETSAVLQFLPLLIVGVLFLRNRKITSFRQRCLAALIFSIGISLIVVPFLYIKKVPVEAGLSPRGGFILSVRAEYMENLYPQYRAHLMGHLFGYYMAQKKYPFVDSSTFRDFTNSKKEYYSLLEGGISPSEVDRKMLDKAFNKILLNPHKYLLSTLIAFVDLNGPLLPLNVDLSSPVSIHPMFAEGRHPEISALRKDLIIVCIYGGWYLLIMLTLCGVFKVLKNAKMRNNFFWVILTILYFNIFFSLVHAIPRYAIPIYPFYIMFFVIGCVHVGTYFTCLYSRRGDLLRKNIYIRMPE